MFEHMASFVVKGPGVVCLSSVRQRGFSTGPRWFAEGNELAKTFQRPITDALTHTGQLAMLRRLAGTEILKAPTLRDMHRVHWIDPDFTNSYGLGFRVWRSGEKTFVGHGGSCPGFRSQLLIKPEEKVAIVFMADAQGADATQDAQRLYDIVGPAISAAVKEKDKEPAPRDPTLTAYAGTYVSTFSNTETAVFLREDGLAMLSLPNTDPVPAISKLEKVGEYSFRRVRKDESLGEPVIFEMGPGDKALRYIVHSNPHDRRR